MKILMVNKFFYIKGGSETYYFSLKRLLESKGHTVIDFSMEDERNFPSPYTQYFVNNIDYDNNSGALSKVKTGLNIIYSNEAKKKFEKLVLDTKPDLIHLHIFQHQISPSILDVIRKYHLPTVYTAHDLKALCLNYKMMHHGRICEQCNRGKYYHCAFNKCVKDSFLKSCINVTEGYVHKWRHSYDVIDKIITPSLFYRSKFIDFGISAEKVVHIPNFLDIEKPDINRRDDNEKYYLYFGRLSEEKGILTLIKAFKTLRLPLYIVGTGSLREYISNYLDKQGVHNIQLLGYMSGQPLKDVVGNAKAIILPSEWYENGPYSAIEALQLGRLIIGSDVGGIPELVEGNGFLFKMANVDSLKKTIVLCEGLDENEMSKMRQRSVDLFNKIYTPVTHWNLLKNVYLEVLRKHGRETSI